MTAQLHRRTSVLSAATLVAALLHSGTKAQTSGSVTWTNLVNVTVNGTILQKTSGCDGCDDAGATSQQELSAGDGYVEFTVGETNTIWIAGLSHGNDGTGYADIDFAFRFNGAGYADVVENGTYQPGGDTTYVAGDVFRVGVAAGKVQYFKNGTLLRESAAAPQYPLLLDTSLFTIGATVRTAVLTASPPPPGGGLLEKSGSPALRSRFTRAQIGAFLPAGGAKGPFTFPAPYYTTGVRLTNASDCAGGLDCLWYVGYSYWRNINNHVARADMYIFLGTDPYRGGVGPILIRYNKVTDEIQNLGALLDPSSTYSYGALGHLDMGFGYAVGADTYNPQPNATILLKFPLATTLRPIGPVVHFNKRWDIVAANHVAHGNASLAAPAESQYACGSNASRVADMADEIICFPLNGSLDVLVAGQVLTDLDALGGQDLNGDDYEQTPKGNLDVTGRYFIWTTNLGGDRLDAFLVKIPAERLMNLQVQTVAKQNVAACSQQPAPGACGSRRSLLRGGNGAR